MAKRKRHAQSGEGVDGAHHKRAKVENSASTPSAGFIDPAGSEGPNKTSVKGQKGPVQASRKHDNARRALKHEGKGKEQSRETVDVPVQNEKAKIDGKDRAGGKKHEAPSPGSRKHNKKLKALKRAEEKEHSGPKVEVPGRNEDGNSDVHGPTEGNNQSTPLLGSRKHKKKPRALRRAGNKEQSGQKAEVTLRNDESDKSDSHEQAEGNEQKASLPGPRKHKNERRALKHQAKEEGQSGANVEVPAQKKERMEPAHQGEVSQKPHPEEVALIDGELPDAPASQNVKVKLKKKHGSYFSKAQRLARRARAAAGDTIKKVESSDQNDAQGPPTILKVDEVQETQQMPVTGKKHKRDKARKQDGKAITITESGKEPTGKDVSEVMERLGRHEVRQPSSKKTTSRSSRKKKLSSLEAEGVRPVENEVIEPSRGQKVQQHSSKKKSKSEKTSKLKSTDVREVERSVPNEDDLGQVVAASYPEWNVARSTGGQMLDADPIFSKDEE